LDAFSSIWVFISSVKCFSSFGDICFSTSEGFLQYARFHYFHQSWISFVRLVGAFLLFCLQYMLCHLAASITWVCSTGSGGGKKIYYNSKCFVMKWFLRAGH
jgi:hypothetical protein